MGERDPLAPEELGHLFRDVPLFGDMSVVEIGQVLSGGSRENYAHNDVIFGEGDEVDAFYVIEAGEATVRKHANGSHIDLATLKAHATFGEMGLVSRKHRSATVASHNGTTCWKVDKAWFNQLCSEGGSAAVKVMLNLCLIMAQRLDALNEAFVDVREQVLACDDSSKRVVELDRFREKLYSEWTF